MYTIIPYMDQITKVWLLLSGFISFDKKKQVAVQAMQP